MNSRVKKDLTLGDRLLILIRENNVTRKEVAEHMEVSGATLTNWTKNGGIDDDNLAKLADYFDINIARLRYGDRIFDHACRQYAVAGNIIKGEIERSTLTDKLICGVFDMAQEEIYVIAADTNKIIDVSSSVLNNTGYSSMELYKMTIQDINPSLSNDEYQRMCKAVSETDSIAFKATHVKRDNTTYNLAIKFRMIHSIIGDMYLLVACPNQS